MIYKKIKTRKYVGVWIENLEDPDSNEVIVEGSSIKEICDYFVPIIEHEGYIEIFEIDDDLEISMPYKIVRVYDSLTLI